MSGEGGASRLGRRLLKVRDRFVAERLDGLLVTHGANVRYLTNFTGTSGALLVGTSTCRLVTDGRYLTAARALLARSRWGAMTITSRPAMAGASA